MTAVVMWVRPAGMLLDDRLATPSGKHTTGRHSQVVDSRQVTQDTREEKTKQTHNISSRWKKKSKSRNIRAAVTL